MTTMKAEDIVYISNRTRKPLTSKINPVWWNDDEERVEYAPW